MSKVALIFGIGSRRGSGLAVLLAKSGYTIHAVVAWDELETIRENLAHLSIHINFHTPNLNESNELLELFRDQVSPDEVYNLLYDHPIIGNAERRTDEPLPVDGMLTLRLLENIRQAGLASKTSFFQEQRINSSADVSVAPERFHSPNACTKFFSQWTVRHFRDNHKIRAVNGFLFDKVLSCDDQVVTMFAHDICQRMSLQFAEIKQGRRTVGSLELHDNEMVGTNGDIDTLLDRNYQWSHPDDLASAIHRALTHGGAEADFILATNQQHSLRQFCEEALTTSSTKIQWQKISKCHVVASDAPTGATFHIKYVGKAAFHGEKVIAHSPIQIMPDDFETSQRTLKWRPAMSFSDIVKEYIQQAAAKKRRLQIDEDEAKEQNADVPLQVGANLLLLED